MPLSVFGFPLSWLNLLLGGLLLALLLGGTFLAAKLLRRLQHEQQRFRTVFEHAMVGMARTSVDRRWIEVNPALCQMLGYPAAELVRRRWDEITHPDDVSLSNEKYNAVLRGECDGYRLEKRYIRQDGSILHANLAIQAIRLPNGEVDYFAAVIEDVSERRLAEKHLQNRVDRSLILLDLPKKAEQLSEADFMRYAVDQAETLTESQIGFMHFINPDGESLEFVTWSTKTLEKYCTAIADSHYPISRAGLWAEAARSLEALIVNDYASDPRRGQLPEGHSILRRLISVPVVEGNRVCMLTGVGNKASHYTPYDVETLQLIGNETWRIVRRQRSDKALRLAMQVVNASPVVCFRWSTSPGWPIVFVSENVQRWGYTPQQLQAGEPSFAAIVHPDDLSRVVAEVKHKTEVGLKSYEQEYRLVTAENQVIWVVDRTQVTRDAAGQAIFYDGVLTDISERKQQQLLLADTLAEQQQLNKRLEDANNQLLQSEKMASIGQLAAGIAHELNNPIGFVHSNLGTLDGYLHDLMAIIDAYAAAAALQDEHSPHQAAIRKMREERDFDYVREDIFKLLSESKDGLSRVRKIVQDMKSFARVGEQEWQEADLHQGLDSTLNIVWNELKYKCQVLKDYGELPLVYCLISQLNQVFMNLLVNAGHAIEQKGTITIRTRRLGADKVSIEIIDTGKGIAPHQLNRVFDPFFTTKPVGKGTGLGLSVSYNIVKRHQGEMQVESALDKGSTFRVILPIHPAAPAAQENSP